jgi:N-methylhydantoinase B
MEIMAVNSRLPQFLSGDMWAAIAAVRIGARRIEELCGKYGTGTFAAALRRFMDYGEQCALAGLAAMPQGRFELSEEQDDGTIFHVAIEITAEKSPWT